MQQIQHEINFRPEYNGPLKGIEHLTTYEAALRFSGYSRLMWLIENEDTLNARKTIGLYQNFFLDPLVLDEDERIIDMCHDERRDVAFYDEIKEIRNALDNFRPKVNCMNCGKKARFMVYSVRAVRGERNPDWAFKGYVCSDDSKNYEHVMGSQLLFGHDRFIAFPLKASEIKKRIKLRGVTGEMSKDAFEAILKATGRNKNQEITPGSAKKFIKSLKPRKPQQMSLELDYS